MQLKMLFFGDSITAASRTELNRLGNGYVSILVDKFSADPAMENFEFINAGINGNTVGDLLARYTSDVLAHQPDIIVIKIGINDAHKDYRSGDKDGVHLNVYQKGLSELLFTLQKRLPQTQLLLMTPYYISDSKTDNLYLKMKKYCDVVEKLGQKLNLPVLDVLSIFDEAVKLKPAKAWAEDQIHPLLEGHTLIAEASYTFLKKHVIKSSER